MLARVQHTHTLAHTRAGIVSTLSYSIAKSGLRTYLFKLFRILIQQLTQSLEKLPLDKVEEWPQIPWNVTKSNWVQREGMRRAKRVTAGVKVA